MHQRSNVICLLAGAAFLLAPLVRAESPQVSDQDRKFLQDAYRGSLMEVHFGNLGVRNGTLPAVKSLGQQLVDDHGKAAKEIEALARKKNVTIKEESPAIPPSLSSKTGKEFDSAFIALAVDDHEKDIQAFEAEIANGSDPEIKKWATDTLRILQAHLSMAKAARPAGN